MGNTTHNQTSHAIARLPLGIFLTYSRPSMLWIRSAPAARIEQHASKRARRSLRKRAADVVADLVKSCRGAVAVSSGLVSRLRDPFLKVLDICLELHEFVSVVGRHRGRRIRRAAAPAQEAEPVEPKHDSQNDAQRPGDVADAHVWHVDH